MTGLKGNSILVAMWFIVWEFAAGLTSDMGKSMDQLQKALHNVPCRGKTSGNLEKQATCSQRMQMYMTYYVLSLFIPDPI